MYEAMAEISNTTVHKVWKRRKAGRPSPVLGVILHGEEAILCGPTGERPPIIRIGDKRQAERLCIVALEQPDRHSAIRYLVGAIPTLETGLAGILNEGLLSSHELLCGTRSRSDWQKACETSDSVLNKRWGDVLDNLGFSKEPLDNLTLLLRSDEERTALAVMLEERETPEGDSVRFNSLSPLSYALNKADKEKLDWVIMLQADRIRLYATRNIGVARRSRTEAFVECQPALLSESNIGLFWLLFSASALTQQGSLSQVLDQSRRFAGRLADKLRERIYDLVVPSLALGIATARDLGKPTSADLSLTYEMALTVLFRLLFIAYAEDRDLLPYKGNEFYRRRSLKQKAQELAKLATEDASSAGIHHWEETSQLWCAVSEGNSEWGVPAYNGAMFSVDPEVSRAGAELVGIRLENSYFMEVLRGLLLIDTPEGVYAPVDFRSLGVREFGTIYEGLLQSELSLAEQDLTLDKKGAYVPATAESKAIVKKGEIYLHDRSGTRKHSGSYYTPEIVVEHLLEEALISALNRHFEHLREKDETEAAERFFNFRVADIAMGSGHFLVAAIDLMEIRMARELEDRPLPGVRAELADLREVARKSLGELGESLLIDDSLLLRRQIARRCIYGVDANPLSVQLARLSIWIHTFVPGLPLSFLDHNLVRGNSVVGVGDMDDIGKKLKPGGSLLPDDTDQLLGEARAPLRRLANSRDMTVIDIEASRKNMEEAEAAIKDTEALCDLITAHPISDSERIRTFQFSNWKEKRKGILRSAEFKEARKDLSGIDAFHFPVRFPEVFLEESPGFDVIIGNPPWQEATVEKLAFWARHFPGLRGLGSREQSLHMKELEEQRPDLKSLFESEQAELTGIRKFLTSSGNYLGMGKGDPDLYKAFCWRFWNLVRKDSGRLGVVLPRSALAAKGSEEFRREVMKGSKSLHLTMLLNKGKWVFPEVHPQYTMALCVIERGKPEPSSIHLNGPFRDATSFESSRKEFVVLGSAEVLSWSNSASLPLFPSSESIEVFREIRKSPSLLLPEHREGTWRARPDGEMHATNQVKDGLIDREVKECPEGFWPVYAGESFNLWTPDTDKRYGFANPEEVKKWLLKKRMKSGGQKSKKSAHSEFSPLHLANPETLPCNKARIAFRDITNRTNQRTVIACLVPPKVFLTNQGPYLLWPFGDEKDQAYLLGILSSIPLDWYARRFVETHLNFHVFNSLPVPRPERSCALWRRMVFLSATLAAVDERYSEWVSGIGIERTKLSEQERQCMIDQINAVAGHLYGLSESQMAHVFETFHAGWDFRSRLDNVLVHYRLWKDRIGENGTA